MEHLAGLAGGPGPPLRRGYPRLTAFRGVVVQMRELSIFIDESGDLGMPAQTHLVSPQVAAATAIMGHLAAPSDIENV